MKLYTSVVHTFSAQVSNAIAKKVVQKNKWWEKQKCNTTPGSLSLIPSIESHRIAINTVLQVHIHTKRHCGLHVVALHLLYLHFATNMLHIHYIITWMNDWNQNVCIFFSVLLYWDCVEQTSAYWTYNQPFEKKRIPCRYLCMMVSMGTIPFNKLKYLVYIWTLLCE